MAKRIQPRPQPKSPYYRSMSNAPEGKDHGPRQTQAKLGFKIAVTAAYLLAERPVFWRKAFYRICDVAVAEDKPIVARQRRRCARITGFMQGLIQKLTGEITGEGPPGRVRAVQTRRKPNDPEPPATITKCRYRRAMIIRVAAPHTFEMTDNTAAGATPQH